MRIGETAGAELVAEGSVDGVGRGFSLRGSIGRRSRRRAADCRRRNSWHRCSDRAGRSRTAGAGIEFEMALGEERGFRAELAGEDDTVAFERARPAAALEGNTGDAILAAES